MVSGPTTFPDSRLGIPNQPTLDSQKNYRDRDQREVDFVLENSAGKS
jgi:hypothetical protein